MDAITVLIAEIVKIHTLARKSEHMHDTQIFRFSVTYTLTLCRYHYPRCPSKSKEITQLARESSSFLQHQIKDQYISLDPWVHYKQEQLTANLAYF